MQISSEDTILVPQEGQSNNTQRLAAGGNTFDTEGITLQEHLFGRNFLT